ncbi:hypothetical protein ACFLZY_01545 [Patescibacteria group bacterium]
MKRKNQHRKSKTLNSRHRRLSIPQNQVHTTKDWVHDAQAALFGGIEFGALEGLLTQRYKLEKILVSSLEGLDSYRFKGTRHLLRCLFLRGMNWAAIKSGQSLLGRNWFRYAVMVQQELTQAILWLPDHVRHALFYTEHKRFKLKGANNWKTIYAGAESVAQVAHALMVKGIPTYLPTLKQDAEYQVDLYAALVGKQYGLALQIKSTIRRQYTIPIIMNHPPCFPNHWPETRFYTRVENFNQQNKKHWVPIFVWVGSKGGNHGPIETYSLTHHATWAMLEEFVIDEPKNPKEETSITALFSMSEQTRHAA